MRRRDIISLILTILLLTVTSRHWLILKPLPVKIVVKGNGDYTFVVQLNKQDNNEFKKIKQCIVRKHLSGEYKTCSCEINRVHAAKRLKLIVNKTPSSSPIEIKEISLKNGRCKLSAFDLKSLHGGGGASQRLKITA